MPPAAYRHALVTGGAGFAGTALCLSLKQQYPDLAVTAFDNLKRRGSELNLSRLSSAGVKFVHGDVRMLSDLQQIAPLPDLIVECSAEPSAQAGYGASPAYLVDTNLTGCYHCLELARLAKADFLFISTSRVYPFAALNKLPYRETASRFEPDGWEEHAGVTKCGITEEFPLAGPRSLYGMTKLAGELLVEEYADAYGIRVIIDRLGLLAGPCQMAKSDQGVLALWVAAHHFRRRLDYIGFGGQGKQVRDFLHIDDFCDFVLDQVEYFDRYQGRGFNVGGGYHHSLSLLEATQLCREITGSEIPIGSVLTNRPADVRIYFTDYTAATQVNGWKPRRGARETLSSIYDWLRENGQRYHTALSI